MMATNQVNDDAMSDDFLHEMLDMLRPTLGGGNKTLNKKSTCHQIHEKNKNQINEVGFTSTKNLIKMRENLLTNAGKNSMTPPPNSGKRKFSMGNDMSTQKLTPKLPVVPKKKRQRWTKKEDDQLKSLVTQFGNKWGCISHYIPRWTPRACGQRFDRLSEQQIKCKKRKWTQEEDILLKEAVQQYGDSKNWRKISSHVRTRGHQQCRYRWEQHLNPTISHEPWSDHEKQYLEHLFRACGETFTPQMYQEHFSNRSTEQIRNMIRKLKLK